MVRDNFGPDQTTHSIECGLWSKSLVLVFSLKWEKEMKKNKVRVHRGTCELCKRVGVLVYLDLDYQAYVCYDRQECDTLIGLE
jgi:hypothetical protein